MIQTRVPPVPPPLDLHPETTPSGTATATSQCLLNLFFFFLSFILHLPTRHRCHPLRRLGNQTAASASQKNLRLVSGNLRSGLNHFCRRVVNSASCAISDSVGNVEQAFSIYGEGMKVQNIMYQRPASCIYANHLVLHCLQVSQFSLVCLSSVYTE